MKVGIIGAGPRGLAVALEARFRGHEPILIDPCPLKTWYQMDPYMAMRSPIGFDLTVGSPHLAEYSLAHWLGLPYRGHISQDELEADQSIVLREQFTAYCESILSLFQVVKDKAVRVVTNKDVFIGSGLQLNMDMLVIAAGSAKRQQLPKWIPSRIVRPLDQAHGKVMVVGGGQSGGEAVSYLVQRGHEVVWVLHKHPKVSRYPVPSWEDWGCRSALGGYYKSIERSEQLRYIQEVRKWQPSITPNLALDIQKALVIKEGQPVRDVDSVVLCGGSMPDIKQTNVLPNLYEKDIELTHLPKLDKGFKSVSGIRFTGLLALGYDGPRQGSVVSSAPTAREIFDVAV